MLSRSDGKTVLVFFKIELSRMLVGALSDLLMLRSTKDMNTCCEVFTIYVFK